MKYDSDIRWMRSVVWVLIATDLILAIRCIYAHDWGLALAAGIWAVNCVCWLGMLRTQQNTRDEARITHAAVLRVLESSER